MTYNHNDFLYDLAKDDPKMIQQIVDPSMELIMKMIGNGWFKYFPDSWKTEEVCLHAIEVDGHNISHINEPSEQLQLAAVKQNGFVIVLIENPSEDVQIEAYDYIQRVSPKETEEARAFHPDKYPYENQRNPH